MNAVRARTPEAEARAASQRERILDAAEQCFIRHGFHGAPIAVIAETSGLSVGLLYRYFESKSAIVLAIIARQLRCRREGIAALYGEDDFLASVVAKFRLWQQGTHPAMNATLFLEMSSEASRDPAVREAIVTSDALTREAFEQWLERPRDEGGVGMTREAARRKAVLVQCVIEGLVVRAVRDPGMDGEALREALEPVFADLRVAAPASA